ncbi:MAG: nucleotidyl transferase AbiEii/AbiGii toxin family protein [Bdellovibrionales bacterium]|nr:nucleotidyl transferase AbiEii/AbiGii toxin family protein [Bdellovibrionales bacterium]
MDLSRLFEESFFRLEKENIPFALCGGYAANLYRSEPRVTGDIDYLISAGDRELELARTIIQEFGLEPRALRLGELTRAPMMSKRSTPYVVVIGRDPKDDEAPGLDILLSTNKWAPAALERAQHHQISVDFGEVPAITREDVLIAKAFAVQNSSRPKDLDDLESIFSSALKLDLEYLCGQLDTHKLFLPREIEKLAPTAARVASKRNRNLPKL